MAFKQTLTLLLACCCLKFSQAQTITPKALEILDASFNKMNELKALSYQMIFVDSMGNSREIHLSKTDTAYVNMIRKDQILYMLGDGVAKFVTKDTLYSLAVKPEKKVTATDNWDPHSIPNYSISDMFPHRKSFFNSQVASIMFYDTTKNNEYVIDMVYKQRSYDNGAVKSKLVYDRIWINKTSLYPVKKRKYSSLIDDLGKESVDIYEYNISLPQRNPAREFSLEIFKDISFRPTVSQTANVGTILLGSFAPNFTATNLHTNKKETLSNYKGKVVLLDFWYLSCYPCRLLMPVLEKMNNKYKGKDFVVVGVNATDKNSIKIKEYLRSKNYRYTQLYNAEPIFEPYNLQAYPTTILIDKQGRIKHIETGYSENLEERMTKMIDVELTK